VYSSTKGETPDGAGEMPVLVQINGIPFWQASGRTFPVVAGAEDPPPADGKKDDPPPDPKTGEGEGDDFDKDRALATIRKLREEQKTAKTQLKELEALKADQKKREDAEKSEAERLKEQIAEAERKATEAQRKLTQTQNRIAIERAAAKAGAADPDDVFRLLSADDFETDDDGNVTNAEKLVEALLKNKPYLAGKSSGTTAVPGTPRSNGTSSQEDQVKKNREELRASGHYNPLG
jgi:chromosome segregation ATPase